MRICEDYRRQVRFKTKNKTAENKRKINADILTEKKRKKQKKHLSRKVSNEDIVEILLTR